jgi:lipopolysaccharide export LptBFGC system permease protein LptF
MVLKIGTAHTITIINMDNVIIAQSSNLYDQMLNTIEENSAKLKALNKQIDVSNKLILEKSVLYEGAKKENRELKASLYKADNVIGILAQFANEHLEMFESIFESDENSFQYDDMEKYLHVARYMRDRYGRNSNYIRRVEERIKALNF